MNDDFFHSSGPFLGGPFQLNYAFGVDHHCISWYEELVLCVGKRRWRGWEDLQLWELIGSLTIVNAFESCSQDVPRSPDDAGCS